jgi:hypothetical protein
VMRGVLDGLRVKMIIPGKLTSATIGLRVET